MGKRTNTKQILQVGKKNNRYIWDSKYFEKDTYESQIYLFQTLEIKKLLKNFLSMYGLHLYKYNINFVESSLKIFISYIKTSQIKNIVPKINANYKLKLVRKIKSFKKLLYKNFIYRKNKKKVFEIKKIFKNKIFYTFFNFYSIYVKKKYIIEKNLKDNFQFFYYLYKLKRNLEKKFKFIYNKHFIVNQITLNYVKSKQLKKLLIIKYKNYLKKLLIKYSNYKKLLKIFLLNKKLYRKRLKILRYYKNYKKLFDTKIFNINNNFLKKFTESFNVFTKNNCNNILILQQINQNIIFNLTYQQLQLLKKLVTQLRQFKNSIFFKDGINTILLSLMNPNSTDSLVNFIVTKLKKVKRHGFFFKFLTKTFSLLLKHKFSKVKSIKILIKGRINGKPRAKQKLIDINNMSLMTINSSINFSQSTSYSPNGTFGVKLWLNSK